MPLAKLKPAARNAKRHDQVNISTSVDRFGFVDPIILDERTQRLVAGHGRRESLLKLKAAKGKPPEGVKVDGGEWLVPVLRGWASRSETEAEAYLLASNKLVEVGGWDEGELAAMLRDLDGADGLDGVGFSDEELERLLAATAAPEEETPEDGEGDGLEEPDTSVPPLPADPWVQLGDVFWLGDHRLMCGDSLHDLDVLLEGAQPSAVVCDPPYEIGFMGKAWDSTGIAYSVPLWRGIFERLKPGAHLIAFGATRTYHRMAVAIEDAGFEIRDTCAWLYGTGFPKSLDVSKAIDNAAGAERKVIGKAAYSAPDTKTTRLGFAGMANPEYTRMTPDITAPATAAAKQWDGWGTALKPALEPAVLARKPIEGTVAANVQKHGCGVLNIKASRIGLADGDKKSEGGATAGLGGSRMFDGGLSKAGNNQDGLGRWPSNVLLDEQAAEQLDEQSGVTTSPGKVTRGGKRTGNAGLGALGRQENVPAPSDTGGASRFFYVAKPSAKEKGDTNTHATVKPLGLMRYLTQLVAPPECVVLEPFAGSGTTLLACEQLGVRCYAMELSPAHVQIVIERWERMTGRKAERVEK